jgi:hypothetical protein
MTYRNFQFPGVQASQLESLVVENNGISAGAAPGQQQLIPFGDAPAGRGPMLGPLGGRTASPMGVPGGAAPAGGFPSAATGMAAMPSYGESWWHAPAQMSAQSSVGYSTLLDGGIQPSFDQLFPTGYRAPFGDAMNPLTSDWMHQALTGRGQAPDIHCEPSANHSDSVTQALPPAALPKVITRNSDSAGGMFTEEWLRDRIDLLTNAKNKAAAERAIAQPLHRASGSDCMHFIEFMLCMEKGELTYREGVAPTVDIEEFLKLTEMQQNWLLDADVRLGAPPTALYRACANVLGIEVRRRPSSKLKNPDHAEAVKRLFHDSHLNVGRPFPNDEKLFCQMLSIFENRSPPQTWNDFRSKNVDDQAKLIERVGLHVQRAVARMVERELQIELASSASSNVDRRGSGSTRIHGSLAESEQSRSRSLVELLDCRQVKGSYVSETAASTSARKMASMGATRVPRKRIASNSLRGLASSSRVQRQPARAAGPIGFDARPVAQQPRPVPEMSTGGTHATSLMASGEPQAYSHASISNWDGAPTQAHLLPPGGSAGHGGAAEPHLPQGTVVEELAFEPVDDETLKMWRKFLDENP